RWTKFRSLFHALLYPSKSRGRPDLPSKLPGCGGQVPGYPGPRLPYGASARDRPDELNFFQAALKTLLKMIIKSAISALALLPCCNLYTTLDGGLTSGFIKKGGSMKRLWAGMAILALLAGCSPAEKDSQKTATPTSVIEVNDGLISR